MIVEDGYNIGRDWLVERAIQGTHYKNRWWRADIEWNENDLLVPGKEGKCLFSSMISPLFLPISIHLLTPMSSSYHRVGVNHGIKQDGRVAILTVNRI